MNYYNDFETGDWLRQLVTNNLIPEGYVDDRSITDIKPQDLDGYEQCHFFAGIAGWPRALELAGWDSTRHIWSASLPCQPFSCAGQQRGEKDERHLWPVFFGLVKECRPTTLLGEQTSSKDGREWLAGIQADLETLGYSTAASDLPAASVASPHKRNRLFWCAVGQPCKQGLEGHTGNGNNGNKPGWNGENPIRSTAETSPTGRVDDSELARRQEAGKRYEQQAGNKLEPGCGHVNFWSNSIAIHCADGEWRRVPGRLVQSNGAGLQQRGEATERTGYGGSIESAGGRVGKHQLEIEPALFPLADGLPGRVGLLKGAGNAIVPQVAAVFIEAVMEIIEPELNRHQGEE